MRKKKESKILYWIYCAVLVFIGIYVVVSVIKDFDVKTLAVAIVCFILAGYCLKKALGTIEYDPFEMDDLSRAIKRKQERYDAKIAQEELESKNEEK